MLKTFLSGASAGKEIVLNFEGKNSLHIEMKQIEVVAAIICREGKYFATQRGYGEFKDYWEFPGGKIEAGESREEALKREIREELDTEISVDTFLTTVECDYPAFHLTMHCFLCSIRSGHLVLKEHEKRSLAESGGTGFCRLASGGCGGGEEVGGGEER